MVTYVGHLPSDEKPLVNRRWRLAISGYVSIGPIGEVKGPGRGYSHFLEDPERPNIDTPELGHEIDISPAAKRMGDDVPTVILCPIA